MNLGAYVKSLVPAILSVVNVIQSWAITGRLNAPTLRQSVVLLVVAAIVYWLPNTPAPVPALRPDPYLDGRLRTDAGAIPKQSS